MTEAIVYYGLNRNGTTWLGNTLHKGFNVTMPFHELNFGVCEVNPYRIHKAWGAFDKENEFSDFLKAYRYSDVFLSLEGDYSSYQNLHFKNFFEFYFDLLTAFSRKQNKSHLAIKIEPLFLKDKISFDLLIKAIQKRCNKIHFFSIQRPYKEYIKSVEGLYKANHRYNWTVLPIYTSEYHHYYKCINKFIQDVEGTALNFSNQNDLNHLIPIIANKLNAKYKEVGYDTVRNTSTSNLSDRLNVRQYISNMFFKNFDLFASFFISLIEYIRFRRNKKPALWNERIHKAMTNPQQLILDFENKYEERLIAMIKEKYLKN